MKWTNTLSTQLFGFDNISNLDEKRAVARKVAAMAKDGDVIGAGSGSTSFVTLQEIGRRVSEEGLSVKIIPTSREMEMTASVLGIEATSLMEDKPDWCYDGADEVDQDGNLIKGRGGAMYREKLVMASSKKSFILVDSSKFVDKLGSKFAVPVEVNQHALHYVETQLGNMDISKCELRPAGGKDGPVITEMGNFILDVTFNTINAETEMEIKSVTGVFESGLFWGFKPEIITV